jgi:hypothetical protein
LEIILQALFFKSEKIAACGSSYRGRIQMEELPQAAIF